VKRPEDVQVCYTPVRNEVDKICIRLKNKKTDLPEIVGRNSREVTVLPDVDVTV
jgi:hypothetical protein